jgi:hypothetical protein
MPGRRRSIRRWRVISAATVWKVISQVLEGEGPEASTYLR